MIEGSAFSPNWAAIIVPTIIVGMAGSFGPDSAERKRNRQELKDKLTRKR